MVPTALSVVLVNGLTFLLFKTHVLFDFIESENHRCNNRCFENVRRLLLKQLLPKFVLEGEISVSLHQRDGRSAATFLMLTFTYFNYVFC